MLWSAVLLFAGLLHAPSQEPTFEVASVKHVGSAIMHGPGPSPMVECRYSGAKVNCRLPLKALMRHACQIGE